MDRRVVAVGSRTGSIYIVAVDRNTRLKGPIQSAYMQVRVQAVSGLSISLIHHAFTALRCRSGTRVCFSMVRTNHGLESAPHPALAMHRGIYSYGIESAGPMRPIPSPCLVTQHPCGWPERDRSFPTLIRRKSNNSRSGKVRAPLH